MTPAANEQVLNPMPWKIIEVKILINPFKVFIRGEGSMWFRADQCYIGSLEDMEQFVQFTSASK